MSVAGRVTEILGGVDVVAKITGLGTTQIYKWRYPRARGGTDGLVPAQYQQPLLDYARANGLPLTPGDFFDAHVEKDKAPLQPAQHASGAQKQRVPVRAGAGGA